VPQCEQDVAQRFSCGPFPLEADSAPDDRRRGPASRRKAHGPEVKRDEMGRADLVEAAGRVLRAGVRRDTGQRVEEVLERVPQ